MENVDRLLEMVTHKLSQNEHSELLKSLFSLYAKAGAEALEAQIKDILSKIEEE